MKQRFFLLNIFLILTLGLFIQASNCWHYIEPEKFAARCPLIIQGKIIRIQGEYKEQAVIKIIRIHKNILSDTPIFSDEFIVYMSPTGLTWENSTDIRYCIDTEGIWLVTLHEENTFSIADHPVQRQCYSSENQLRKKGIFKNRDKKSFSQKEWTEKNYSSAKASQSKK